VKAPEGHIDTEQLAKRLKVCVGTLRNWRCKGLGPKGKRILGRVFYDLESVRRWEIKHFGG
jgi:DNA-binding transcriptional MerR regulator